MAITYPNMGLTPKEKYLKEVNEISETLKSNGVKLTESLFQGLMGGGEVNNGGDQIRNKVASLCNHLRRIGNHHGIKPENVVFKDGVASLKDPEEGKE